MKKKHRQAKREKRQQHRKSPQRELEGVFCGTRHGYGFVAVEGREEDVFIPYRDVRTAVTGDRVRIKLGARGAGEVLSILERKHEEVVGVLRESEESELYCEPRIDGFPIVQLTGVAKGGERPAVGMLVVVRIRHYAGNRRPYPEGEIVRVLGASGDPEAEEEAVILKYSLRNRFSKSAEAEAEAYPKKLSEKEFAGRKDLRSQRFFTIDGRKARDFDDAVCLEKRGNTFRLWVAIADVAHYVRPDSALDQEAYLRGTSVYFPTRALHMLPHALSTGLCSLVPNEDRLALVAELEFDQSGRRTGWDFYEAVFRSHARLTYEEVEEVFRHGRLPTDKELLSPLANPADRQPIEQTIQNMRELQLAIGKIRKARGSLDFDVPEAEFIFDEEEGERAIEAIVKGTRLQSHRMIEEFMVAANEAVSEFLTEKRLPIPYRVHEPPDPLKIQDFFNVLQKVPQAKSAVAQLATGKRAPGKGAEWARPGFIANLLEDLKDLPQAHLLHHLLLTSMKLAVYSAENKGHFGLASQFYSHFTSPIRRYPDLLLHRLLKSYLHQQKSGMSHERMADLTLHCSGCEQIAVRAERDLQGFYKVLFMSRHLGKVFPGRIEKILESGFFVELDPFFVDGFVPLETLKQDNYRYNPGKQELVGHKHTYRQGDALEVQVGACDLDRRRLTFLVPKADA